MKMYYDIIEVWSFENVGSDPLIKEWIESLGDDK